MAIPFVLPTEEDHGRTEVELEHLLSELIDINQQIQILLRARMQQRASTHTSSQRVCPSRHHQRNQTPAMQPFVLPDLVRSTVPTASTPESPLMARHQRTDATDSSTCCYHAKITTHMFAQEQDAAAGSDVDMYWKQVGAATSECDAFKAAERLPFMAPLISPSTPQPPPPTYLVAPDVVDSAAEEKSLLAKIIPATTSSRSLWTAVLCVVGWQIFRAR